MTGCSAQPARPVVLRLSLICNLKEVRPAASLVTAFLLEQKLSWDEARACELAFVEACNNAMQYASETGRLRPVEVDVICETGMIEMRVTDHTAGFEWPDRVELPEPEQERGRGLFLIQSLMDGAHYFRGNGTNCLVMKKKRSSASELMPDADQASGGSDEIGRKLAESEQIISDMAEELSFCYESLSAIFRSSAELCQSNNLAECSQRLLSDLAQITSADWFLLRLNEGAGDAEGSKLVVFTSSDPGVKLPPLPLSAPEDGTPIPLEAEAALNRQDVWFDLHRPLEPHDPLWSAWRGSAGLIHPFYVAEELIGTLAVGKAGARAHFTAVHANVVHTFSDFLALQIVNARFREQEVASRIVSRELEIARAIQRSLLPKSLPELAGFSLAGSCESASRVGGDFYDVLKIDDASMLLIIADVMGKGLPAAMFASILRTLLRANPEWTNRPADLLSRVNRLLYRELSGVDMFITAQLVYVDAQREQLIAAAAGHCPLFVAEPDRAVKAISPEGLPLGILPDTAFGTEVERLTPDSRVFLYTDGLTEARNAEGEFFGQDRLAGWFRESLKRNRTAEELKRDLTATLNAFQAGGACTDDQTFLILAQ